jgi:uncharacterized protein YkwD
MPRFVVESRTLFALVVGGCLFLVLAPGAWSSNLRGQATVSSQEQNLLRSINQARARYGAPPLRIASPLQRAARSHSKSMLRTGNFTHGDWYRRLRRYGANAQKLGETIAWGVGTDGTAAAIVRTWLASPPHRSTLLDRGFRYVGVGVAVGSFSGYGGASIATADFGGR